MKIKTLFLALFTSFFTLFICLISIPWIFFIPNLARILARIWTFTIVYASKLICGISWKIEGKELIEKNKQYIVISKHVSAWETFFLFYYFKSPAFILKKQLFNIPFFGWYLMCLKPIGIDRSAGTGAIKKIISQAKKRLTNNKMNIIIFPQGTRVIYGQDYSLEKYPYKRGFLPIIERTDAEILLVNLNPDQTWGRSLLSNKKSGLINIKITKLERNKNNNTRENLLEKISNILEDRQEVNL